MGSTFGINYKRTYAVADIVNLPAGLRTRGENNFGSFIFVVASAGIAQFAAVGVNGAGSAAELTTTTYATSAAVGFAQVAVLSGEYFWLWVGKGGGTGSGIKGNVAASYAAGALINTTATAGLVDDAATKILGGVVGLTTAGGATVAVELMAAGYIIKVTA